MKKDLPRVYANKIDKEIKNNKCVAYNKAGETEEVVETSTKRNLNPDLNGNINQKIRDIFNSRNYIYKADVIITLKDKKISKRIIGKNNNHLITYDNDLIPITDIIDIEYK